MFPTTLGKVISYNHLKKEMNFVVFPNEDYGT